MLTVRVWNFLHEHHRWEIVEVPICWDFDHPGVPSRHERLHPGMCWFRVVDWCPIITSTQIVGLTVVVGHAVVVFDAVGEIELCCFF